MWKKRKCEYAKERKRKAKKRKWFSLFRFFVIHTSSKPLKVSFCPTVIYAKPACSLHDFLLRLSAPQKSNLLYCQFVPINQVKIYKCVFFRFFAFFTSGCVLTTYPLYPEGLNQVKRKLSLEKVAFITVLKY